MPFNQKPQKFNAKINTVKIGTGEKAIEIGGECTFPFYTFDSPMTVLPKVGIEITDLGLEGLAPCIRPYYEDAATMAELAVKAASFEGVDFLVLYLEGGDANGAGKPVEELLSVVKEVADAVDLPLVIQGCRNVEKDAELLPKAAELLQ